MHLEAGGRLGFYRLIAPLGAGGMGEVWKARDEKLDRDVALKALPARLSADPEALVRFEREAKAVAALSHPNILAIYDFGQESGRHFAVMELLEGQTLREILSAGPLPPRKAVEYGRQIAEGLAAAHARGIVHRDLKPENLFVTRDGHVKILDFGLAVQRTAGDANITSSPTVARVTEPGVAMGTAGYMAPEQVRGGLADHRADIFALGAVLYEMLAGRRAFERETGAEMMTAILREDAPPLSSVRTLPPALEQIVEHCLEKRPEDRFQSARDLAFALVASGPGSGGAEVADAVSPSGSRRAASAPTDVKRPAWLWPAAIALAILALAGSAYFVLRAKGSSDLPRRIAVLPLQSEDPAFEFFAEGVGDSIYTQLTRIPGLVVTGRGSSASFKGQTVDLKDVRAKLGVDAVLQGRVSRSDRQVRIALDLVRTADGSAIWSGNYDGDIGQVGTVQDTVVREVAGALRVAPGDTLSTPRHSTNPEARDFYLRGRSKAQSFARQDLEDAITLYDQALARDPQMAEAYAGIAWAWTFLADSYLSPAEAYPKAKEAAQKALSLDASSAEGHAALGNSSWLFDWNVREAEAQFRRATELSSEPEYRALLGLLQCSSGRGGLAEIDAAVSTDPLRSDLWLYREMCQYTTGRYRDVLAEHQRAMNLKIASVYLDSFEGAAYRELGMFDKALASYERDLKLYGGTPLFGLAVTYAKAGRKDDARRVIETLEAYRRDHYYPVELIAVAYANVGDMDRAFEWMNRVFETRSFVWSLMGRAADWEPLHRDPRWAALMKRAGLG
jgi:TolB-like protein/tetratricopeptide (TPR) repeat protein